MKVIFLDHDGVICLSNCWGSRFKTNDETIDSAFDRFDRKALKVLNEILDETDAEIVVSSDWRLHATLEQLQELYKVRGIHKVPISTTGDPDAIFKDLERGRIQEIKDWLADHPEVTQWVAVDDLEMFDLDNFVHTPRMSEGIKQSGVKEKIIKFLMV